MSTFSYPVVLGLDGRPCLVVGGGVIAERKITGLLDARARVTILSPFLSPALTSLGAEGRFRWIPREYVAGDTVGYVLVMVATNDRAVNAQVSDEARARGVWVNCADDPARSDLILPSVLHRGVVTVSVSTGGASPAMARLVREEIDRLLPPEYGPLTEMVADVRRALLARGVSLDYARWQGGVDDELKRLVAAGRSVEARLRLEERLGV